MNNIRNIESITEQELNAGIFGGLTKGSWHEEYSASAWVFLGGFPFELSEGDIICVMSQWGEIEDINLVRDKVTNKSKGFAFIKYEDNRSTILAVDNFNGMKLLGRTLRCDHVQEYKLPKEVREKEMEALDENPEIKVSIGPGHAYKNSEFATEHDVVQGVDLWRQPKPSEPIPSSSANGVEDKEDGHKRSKKDKKEHKEKKSKHKKEKSEKRHRSEDESREGESHQSKRATEGTINIKEEESFRRDDGYSRADERSRHRDSRMQDRHRDSSRDRSSNRGQRMDSRDRSRDRDHKDRRMNSSRGDNKDRRRDSRDRSRDRDHKDKRRDSSRDRGRDYRDESSRVDMGQAATRGGGVVAERNTSSSAVSRAPLPFVPSGAVASWRGNRDPNAGLAASAGSSGGQQMAMMGGRKPLSGPAGSGSSAAGGVGAVRKDPSVSGIGGFSRVR